MDTKIKTWPEIIGVYTVLLLILTILYQLRHLALINQIILAIAALLFIYLPHLTGKIFRRSFPDNFFFPGFTSREDGPGAKPLHFKGLTPILKKDLKAFLLACALILPPFTIGYGLYARYLFNRSLAEVDFGLFPHIFPFILTNLLLISFPEEYFYRGYLQSRLNALYARHWKIGPVFIGPSLLITALLFGLGHVIVGFDPLRVVVFFPALIFGYLREYSGSIISPILFHAACNIYIAIMEASFLGLHR